jgi:aryl-alcohol dehydrogenase-like predicted oxidoreductase
MRYTTFGRRTGLRVSEYALGTGNFGTRRSPGSSPEEARLVFDAFAEAGGMFIDTSASYQFGQAEELLGGFLRSDRDHFVVATKYTNPTDAHPRVSDTGNGRKNMVRSLEASLKRLRTDYVDLFWAHAPDTVTPLEETLAAFDDLVRAGKIHHAGLSNFPAWRTARAATIAELRGLAPVIAIQSEYSLIERSAERELLPMAESLGLGVGLWSPLGGGLLTGKYRDGGRGRLTNSQGVIQTDVTEQKAAIVDAVMAIASEIGASPSQVSLAWMLQRAARSTTSLVPVIGPRNLAQLHDHLGALDVGLNEAHLARLDQVSGVALGVPHEIAALVHDSVLGGDASRFRPPSIPVA